MRWKNLAPWSSASLAAGSEPATIESALQGMPDGFRCMLLKAVGNDRTARLEAIATQGLWLDHLPQSVRNNADFMVNAWVKDHRGCTQAQADARRVDIVLRLIQTRKGCQIYLQRW